MTARRGSSDTAARQAQVDRDIPELADLALLLDSRWRIPGTRINFGVDALAGLLPVVGDSATAVISAYIIYKAHRLGAPRSLLTRMAINVGLDTVVGSVPLLGSVFDLFFKANNINVRLLRDHLQARGKTVPELPSRVAGRA